MRFEVIAPVPEVFGGWREASILGRAQQTGAVQLRLHALRDWATDRHGTLDDVPYGGGAGMVLKPEPLAAAIEAVQAGGEPAPVVLMSAQGERFTQALAREWSRLPRLILVCGRYEGVDERVCDGWIDRQVSIGDYVLTGGEPAAIVVIEATARLVPGVVGDPESLTDESFAEPLLEYPHYTRPAAFGGREVPAVLLAGHHERVRLWRRLERLRRTLERRPELFGTMRLSAEDRRLLARIV